MKTPIKYDKQFNMACLILMIVSGVLLVLLLICMLIPDEKAADAGGFVIFIAVAGVWSIPLFALSSVLYIDSHVYLKRLEKNHFIIPYKKKEYDNDLSRVPRDQVVENLYSGDSRIASIISVVFFAIFLINDLLYLKTWLPFEPDSAKAMFPLLIAFHFIFLIMAAVYRRQGNTEKYVDEVDVRDRRKARASLAGAVGTLILLGLIAAYSVATAHSMTKYVYKSKNGAYDKELEDFWKDATMEVTSKDLHDGKWSERITNTQNGENLSPQLSFTEVPGAQYYVIYMEDESANYWVHWYADDVHETELASGANQTEYEGNPSFKYVGPYPPAGSGEHTYTIYVYAMKGKPDSDFDPEFDEPWLRADYLYYDHLNVLSRGNIDTYGNVLAYGYISGVYSQKK